MADFQEEEEEEEEILDLGGHQHRHHHHHHHHQQPTRGHQISPFPTTTTTTKRILEEEEEEEEDVEEARGSLISNSNVSTSYKTIKPASLFGGSQKKKFITMNDVELYPLPSEQHLRNQEEEVGHHGGGSRGSSRREEEEEEDAPRFKSQREAELDAFLEKKISSIRSVLLLTFFSSILSAIVAFFIIIFAMTRPEWSGVHNFLVSLVVLLFLFSLGILFYSISTWRGYSLLRLMKARQRGHHGPSGMDEVFGWTLHSRDSEAWKHYRLLEKGPREDYSSSSSSSSSSPHLEGEEHFLFCGEGIYVCGLIEPFDGMTKLKSVRFVRIQLNPPSSSSSSSSPPSSSSSSSIRVIYLRLERMGLERTKELWITVPSMISDQELKHLYAKLKSATAGSPDECNNEYALSDEVVETDVEQQQGGDLRLQTTH